jgi:S-adenosylmethionine:tRNA ribosyltransferase-isomerase
MKLSEFDFFLPKELIAKHPKIPRSSSKLLHLSTTHAIRDYNFQEIIDLFRAGDLLVLNDTKVIPAYLNGSTLNTEKVEKHIVIYLNKKLCNNTWRVFAKPGKLINIGKKINFSKGLEAVVIEKNVNSGEVTLLFNMSGVELFHMICNIGKMPIPPYFKRKPEESDNINYQTVFAKNYTSVAAPTAGLHFDNELLQKIKDKGVDIAYITLHIGSGTFMPVKVENISDHKMHYEEFSISHETANLINQKKEAKQRIICVGTTSLRSLEAAANVDGIISPHQMTETNIFITPGYKFKATDVLITNFHTPKSTLFMLVCAFSGMQNIKNAYQHAIQKGYRFFSYGDACWLDKDQFS